MLFQKSYWLNVTAGIDVIPLIHDVKLAVRESGVKEGLLTVYVPDGRGAIVLAPEGLDKDREFLRWLKDWVEPKPKVKEEQPKQQYLGYLFGATQTLPLAKGGMTIDLRSGLFLLDCTDSDKRRECCIAIFSESPKKDPKGQSR